uniref:Eukaryotic translation initiation factor 3 subunit G n=1 Tax=Blastobotrys adeninivorans TaxID=409370 RepID=A0A060TCY9_BLAAD
MADTKKSTWADVVDDEDGLPNPEITQNPDGTKTVVMYRLNADGKKIKITQKVREVKTQERVEPAVAARKKWAKYGAEKGAGAGPNLNTTSVEPNIVFKLGLRPSKAEEEAQDLAKAVAEPAPESKIVCRLCGGPHFTLKCPYKDTLGASEDAAAAAEKPATMADKLAASAGSGGSSYVPPHLRAGARLDRTGGVVGSDRDDSSTLRVSNLSEDITEEELRSLFNHFGRIARCYLVRDRETGRNRGFAFVSYENRSDAEIAQKRLDGYGLDNLIMRVEFSKKRDP